MRKEIGMLVIFVLFATMGYAQQSLADDDDSVFIFRSTDDSHPKGYEYGGSITCLDGEYRVLMRGYDGRTMATEVDYPKLFVYLEGLRSQVPSNPTCSNEWEVLDGTYKGFSYEKSSSFAWVLFYPVIQASGSKGYTFRTTPKHHSSGYAYSVSITYLGGKYRVLLRGYGNRSAPKDSEYQDLFVCLERLQTEILSVEATGNEVAWDVYPGTFKGFHAP